MTHDHRTDPVTGDPVADETRLVERQTYVERERVAEPDPGDTVAPAYQPSGGQVNVNSGPAYVEAAEPGPLYWARRVLTLLFGILVALIGLRIVLLLLVANESNSIVNFIYDTSEPFVAPFRGMFNLDTVSPGGESVLDVAAVVALVGWLLIYALLMAILRLGDRSRVTAA